MAGELSEKGRTISTPTSNITSIFTVGKLELGYVRYLRPWRGLRPRGSVVSLWEVACQPYWHHATADVLRQGSGCLSRSDRCSMRCRTPMLYWLSMRSAHVRAGARAAAWLLLALVALDLGNPSLCALDQESESRPVSAPAQDLLPSDGGTPTPPAHVDDCFCCSHCVDVAAIAAPAMLSLVGDNVSLPAERTPFPTGYPPYHPPKV